jgi:hypothetical protein
MPPAHELSFMRGGLGQKKLSPCRVVSSMAEATTSRGLLPVHTMVEYHVLDVSVTHDIAEVRVRVQGGRHDADDNHARPNGD